MQSWLPLMPRSTARTALSNYLIYIIAAVVFIVLIFIPILIPSSSSSSSKVVEQKQTQQQTPVGEGEEGSSISLFPENNELLYRLLISAFVTLIYEMFFGHAVDLIKIHMQTSQDETYRQGIANIIAKRENGVWALWDGFVPWGILQSVTKGGAFGMAHAMWTNIFHHLLGPDNIKTMWAKTLAGALAGAVQGYLMTPTLLLKTRIITRTSKNTNNNKDESLSSSSSSSSSSSLTQSLRVMCEVIRHEGGIAALFKGAHVFALKRFLDWSTRFYFANLMEYILLFVVKTVMAMQQHQQQSSTITIATTEEEAAATATIVSLSLSHQILASLVGGFLSCCCTTPLDSLVAKIQDAKRAGTGASSNNSSMCLVLRQEFMQQHQRVRDDDETSNGDTNSGDDVDDDPAANKSNGIGSSRGASSSSSSYSHASFYRGFQARVLHVSLTTVVLKTVSPWVYDKLCQPSN